MTDFSTFSSVGIPLGLITQLGFYLILGAYAVFTGIFYYHWQTYSTNAKVTGLTYLLYFSSTLPLLVIMGIMTFLL